MIIARRSNSGVYLSNIIGIFNLNTRRYHPISVDAAMKHGRWKNITDSDDQLPEAIDYEQRVIQRRRLRPRR